MSSPNNAEIENEYLLEILKLRSSSKGSSNIRVEHIIARDTYGRSCLHIALFKLRNYDDFLESLESRAPPKLPKICGWPSLVGLEIFLRDGDPGEPFYSLEPDAKPSDIPVNLDLVKQLIDAGADVNAMDSEGNSCLHYAAENEDCLHEISVLIQAGANLESLNKLGDTPLLTAVKVDNLKGVEALIKHGADINVSNHHRDTVLHLAGKDAMLCFLLDAGCTVSMNQTNECGCSPFLAAIEYCGVQTLEKMIQAGADINFLHEECDPSDCSRWMTPLRVAIAKNRDEVVELLLKHGANPDEDCHDESLLYYAASFMSSIVGGVFVVGEDEKSANILQLIIAYGADICTNHRAFRKVITNGNIRAIELCLNEFHRKRVPMRYIDPLLHLALHNRRDDVFKFAIESNFNDIDAKDREGYTALHRAIEFRKKERVKILLDYGADVNTSNDLGETAFQSSSGPFNDGNLLISLLQQGSVSSWKTDITNLDISFFHKLPQHQNFQQKIRIIVMHLALVESFGYPLAPSVLKFMMTKYPKSVRELYESCREEIELSQRLLIGKSIAVYDVLTNVDHRHARNENQVEKFIDRDLHKQFPVYESLIRHRFALSKEKLEKVSKAIKGLSLILQMDYQTFHHIYENIMHRLRPIDLLILERI